MLAAGCKNGDVAITETRTTLQVGERSVDLVVYATEAPGLTYVNVHDNEQTSVEAALQVLRARGGNVIVLKHSGERNITFTLGDSVYVFDPNRMFTDEGARRTLEDLSRYTPEAHAAVRQFAEEVLAFYNLPALTAVITLHNNTGDEYTALSYAAGGEYETDARAVFVREGSDPDDFFFVTDAGIYDALRARGFNVVLQDNEQATDDGSLSVYCGQHGLPYINAEAQHGHLRPQVAMLKALDEMLRVEQ